MVTFLRDVLVETGVTVDMVPSGKGRVRLRASAPEFARDLDWVD